MFLNEFHEFLEYVKVNFKCFVVCGDFNIHVNKNTNPETVTNPENIAQFVNRKTREWLIENVKAYNAKVAAAAARDAALSAIDFDITDPQL